MHETVQRYDILSSLLSGASLFNISPLPSPPYWTLPGAIMPPIKVKKYALYLLIDFFIANLRPSWVLFFFFLYKGRIMHIDIAGCWAL